MQQRPAVDEAEQVWFAASLCDREWGRDRHHQLLGDRLRATAYHAAIKAVVRPGMVVADVSAGTGVLALWALEAGARVVHAIEPNPYLLAQACQRLDRAGLLGRCRMYSARSSEVQLPEPVDLVVSDLLGNLADNEGMTPILNDAHARFLRPGGQMMPLQATTFLAPVAAERAWAQVAARSCRGLALAFDLDELLASLEVGVFHMPYDVILPGQLQLAPPARVVPFVLDGRDPDHYQRRVPFIVERPGLFTGWKGTFTAELGGGVVLDSGGDDVAGGRASAWWRHAYLPVERPVEVLPGDEIELDYRRTPAPVQASFGSRMVWSGSVRRNGRLLQSLSSRPLSEAPEPAAAPAGTAA